MEADELRDLIYKRTRIIASELKCPREKSFSTPCVARDGDLAMDDAKFCVGCDCPLVELLRIEKKIHTEKNIK